MGPPPGRAAAAAPAGAPRHSSRSVGLHRLLCVESTRQYLLLVVHHHPTPSTVAGPAGFTIVSVHDSSWSTIIPSNPTARQRRVKVCEQIVFSVRVRQHLTTAAREEDRQRHAPRAGARYIASDFVSAMASQSFTTPASLWYSGLRPRNSIDTMAPCIVPNTAYGPPTAYCNSRIAILLIWILCVRMRGTDTSPVSVRGTTDRPMSTADTLPVSFRGATDRPMSTADTPPVSFRGATDRPMSTADTPPASFRGATDRPMSTARASCRNCARHTLIEDGVRFRQCVKWTTALS